MDRAEAAGLGVAAAGHVALLALLSAGFAAATREPTPSVPMEVSFVEEVDLVSAAPTLAEAPAPSIAPEIGAPEEAAPAPEPVPAPPAEPLPPPPRPVEPAPQPKPEPAPKPKAEPARKPVPQKPAPKPAAKKASEKPAPKPAAKAAPTQTKAAAGSGQAEKTRGSRLGSDFLKGIGSDPTPSRSQAATGAVMSAKATADIASAITRQVQPCANQQVKPGPGAERIRVTMNLRLNRDGSLAARPRVVGITGVDDENRRYADRVEDLAIATFVGCSPLRGLPADLYDVPKGWSNFSLRYKLPD